MAAIHALGHRAIWATDPGAAAEGFRDSEGSTDLAAAHLGVPKFEINLCISLLLGRLF